MKKLLFALLFTCAASVCFAQKTLISYEDLKLLLHTNLMQDDTFLMAKGFIIKSKSNKTKNREYSMAVKGNTYVSLTMRADGKKIFMELETNDIQQFDLINNSIAPFLNKAGSMGDVLNYDVKNLCNIYVTVSDSVPYDPLKKDYLMQIVPDKNVTAYD